VIQSPDSHKANSGLQRGFTIAEILIAVTLVGIGITTTLATLTKINSFANTNRSFTGAYAAAMTNIDTIQSSPFNPNAQVPQVPPLLDKDNSPIVETNIPIYKDPISGTTVFGTRTTTVVPAAGFPSVTVYCATVTVTWFYQGRGPNRSTTTPYQVQLSTLRASDS
jgi:prepilin-type N-terminal cleavage/methylation domain-containing protein